MTKRILMEAGRKPPASEAYEVTSDVDTLFGFFEPTISMLPWRKEGMIYEGHRFDNEFLISGEHRGIFRRDGFVKPEGFFNPDVVDALLFNKMVVHRSMMLGEGTLPKRATYVMRFVDARGIHDDPHR